MLPLSVVAGTQKMLTVTLKLFSKNIFQACDRGDVQYSLIYLKAKNEEKFKNIFDLVQIKNSFAHFGKIKIKKKKNISQILFL